LTAALPVAADADPDIFRRLVDELTGRVATAGCSHVLIGLHEADPLLAVLRPYRATWYTTRLFLVCWPDGDAQRLALDGRPPYLELGSL
jgi:hypothetical protein